MLTWNHGVERGSGRSSIWISPYVPGALQVPRQPPAEAQPCLARVDDGQRQQPLRAAVRSPRRHRGTAAVNEHASVRQTRERRCGVKIHRLTVDGRDYFLPDPIDELRAEILRAIQSGRRVREHPAPARRPRDRHPLLTRDAGDLVADRCRRRPGRAPAQASETDESYAGPLRGRSEPRHRPAPIRPARRAEIRARRRGPTEQEALRPVEPEFAHRDELRLASRPPRPPSGARARGRTRRSCAATPRSVGEPSDHRTVDLQLGDRQGAHAGLRLLDRAHVVDRDSDPDRADPGQLLRQPRRARAASR